MTPSLDFLPRRATAHTLVETADACELRMPHGAHILLDVWHANRHEDHLGRWHRWFSRGEIHAWTLAAGA